MEVPYFEVSGSIPEIFALDIVSGDLKNFNTAGKAIISQTTAKRLFKDISPIGSVIKTLEDQTSIEIVAVYKDLPRNSSLKNGVLKNIGPVDHDAWGTWDYFGYFLLKPHAGAEEVGNLFAELYAERFDKDNPAYPSVRFTNLHKRYFVKNNATNNQGNWFTVISLFGISFLILCVAVINFINFSISLIPLRIRQLNLRKILGEQRAVLIAQQIAGTMFIAIIAGLIALLIVYGFSVSGYTYLVDADLSWNQNWEVMKYFILTVLLTGFVSGVYPAFYGTSIPPVLILKGSFSLSSSGKKLRTAMIGFQYCVSIMLIILAFSIRSQYDYVTNNYGHIDLNNVVVGTLDQEMLKKYDLIQSSLAADPNIMDITFSHGKIIANGGMGW